MGAAYIGDRHFLRLADRRMPGYAGLELFAEIPCRRIGAAPLNHLLDRVHDRGVVPVEGDGDRRVAEPSVAFGEPHGVLASPCMGLVATGDQLPYWHTELVSDHGNAVSDRDHTSTPKFRAASESAARNGPVTWASATWLRTP